MMIKAGEWQELEAIEKSNLLIHQAKHNKIWRKNKRSDNFLGKYAEPFKKETLTK